MRVRAAAGVTQVDRDVQICELLAERFRQTDDTGLGGGVGTGVGVAFLAGNRGDVDDSAVALSFHRRYDGAIHMEGADQVHIHDVLDFATG